AATIADGIAVRRPAERTLAIVKRLVDDVITVSDEAIARAIVVLLERTKLLAEGAGAAALAAVLERDGRIGDGRKVGVVISGGNIDPNLLGKALQQGLVSAGRYLAFRTWLEDKPGMLHELTGLLAREHINILHVGIHRLGPYALLGRVGLDVIVDTRDRAPTPTRCSRYFARTASPPKSFSRPRPPILEPWGARCRRRSGSGTSCGARRASPTSSTSTSISSTR